MYFFLKRTTMWCNLENFHDKVVPYGWLIILLVLWEFMWKLIAMWKSARNNKLGWFICIAIFNTIGILPIIYILMDMKRKKMTEL